MNDVQKQQTLLWLFKVRDKILDRATLKQGDIVVDIGAGTGLLAFGAYEKLKGSGKIIVSDAFSDCVEECRKTAKKNGIETNMEFLQTNATDIKLPNDSVNVVLLRSVLVHISNKLDAIKEFYRILKKHGRLSIFEPIIKKNTKYYELIKSDNFPNYEQIKKFEKKMASDENDPLVNFDEYMLRNYLIETGFKNIDIEVSIESSTYQVHQSIIDLWFSTPPSPGKPVLKQKFLEFMGEQEVNNFIEMLKHELIGRRITLNSPVVYVFAEK